MAEGNVSKFICGKTDSQDDSGAWKTVESGGVTVGAEVESLT